ncbi:Hypothetical_protein [Hexamita inflata]|uniref:Hypothetical_protein n=1 Tax=Hexamita inflata TaxID=28002 RepID=A0ABP1GWV4_9EUKA
MPQDYSQTHLQRLFAPLPSPFRNQPPPSTRQPFTEPQKVPSPSRYNCAQSTLQQKDYKLYTHDRSTIYQTKQITSFTKEFESPKSPQQKIQVQQRISSLDEYQSDNKLEEMKVNTKRGPGSYQIDKYYNAYKPSKGFIPKSGRYTYSQLKPTKIYKGDEAMQIMENVLGGLRRE